MRPVTLAWFERLYIICVTVSFFVRFREFRESLDAVGPIVMLITFAILVLIPVALALFVSRRRSRIALIFLILFTWALGFIWGHDLLEPDSPIEIVELLLTVAPMALTLLLFTPSARAWLKASAASPISPEKLESTFE
jgi:hypothetical protein